MREFFVDPQTDMTVSERRALAESLFAIEKVSFSDPWSEKAFREAFDNRALCLVTLYEDGVLAGYAWYALVSPEAELLNLAVSPEFRRRGLATALLDFADCRLRDAGVRDIYLEVRKSNYAAESLYRGRGFTPVGMRRAYYRFPTEDAIVMALRFD